MDANIFPVEYCSRDVHPNEFLIKKHLRMASGTGSTQAQETCRHVFGRRIVLKGVKVVEEECEKESDKKPGFTEKAN